jgi:transcriptional regulator NrdR family protein
MKRRRYTCQTCNERFSSWEVFDHATNSEHQKVLKAIKKASEINMPPSCSNAPKVVGPDEVDTILAELEDGEDPKDIARRHQISLSRVISIETGQSANP